jgi:putative transposase
MKDGQPELHRRSIRLKEYDYTLEGGYFITIVSMGHHSIFGNIDNNKAILNDLGKIVNKCWQNMPDHFNNITVEPFIVMPNHIHGIVTIYDDDGRGTIYRAPTMEKYGRPTVGSIPTIIRTYKAAVSRNARRELGIIDIWQRNYYERVIRDRLELENISSYIISNPENWANDPEFT